MHFGFPVVPLERIYVPKVGEKEEVGQTSKAGEIPGTLGVR